MKLKYIAVLGFAALLTASSIKEVIAQNPVSTGTEIVAQGATLLEGIFQAGEHPTQGSVSIVTEGSRRYVTLSQDFKSEKGPDLYVILYKTSAPPKGGLKRVDYYAVAPLKNTSGTQRYALPDKVNLANYKSVAIWCHKFNATFGYAPLSGLVIGN